MDLSKATPIDWILYVYWVFCIVLIMFGLPHTLRAVKFPAMLMELFHYGKIRGSHSNHVSSKLLQLIEIPKKWFLHFYILGVIVSTYMVTLSIGTYWMRVEVAGVKEVAAFIGQRQPVIDEYAVTIVCCMMFIQHTRRIYECLYVSVYSKGTMNVIHYLMAVLLYTTVQLCAFADGPNLLQKRPPLRLPTTIDEFTLFATHHWLKFVGILLFMLASVEHHRAHVILGNLRKDRTGQKVLHRQHVIPRGGMFEYLSAPHFLFEILIYIAMALVSWNSWTFCLGPMMFTTINQLLMINETHNWYRDTFPNYPKIRKRVIPYVL